jgi:hypothetical protein
MTASEMEEINNFYFCICICICKNYLVKIMRCNKQGKIVVIIENWRPKNNNFHGFPGYVVLVGQKSYG